MRRIALMLAALVLVLGACGSDKKEVKPAASTTSTAATSPPETASTTSTTSVAATSIVVTPTTAAACPNTGSTLPRSTAAAPAALLTKVTVTNSGCRDSVTFAFRKNGAAVPSCKVDYQPGPFTQDASGAAVSVAGTAFVVVRCQPAYGTDFENGGAPTYTGPKRVVATGTRHVREVVETGDFEGVMSWVIGVDAQRAFGITAGGVPERQLIVTFS